MKTLVYLFIAIMIFALGYNAYSFDFKLDWNSNPNSTFVVGAVVSLVALLGSVVWLSFDNLKSKLEKS